MKIGIDTFGALHGKNGPGSYLKSLTSRIPNGECEITLFGTELDRYTYSAENDEATYKSVPVRDTKQAFRFWHYWQAASFCKKQAFDTVFFPCASKLLPKKSPCRSVAVVFDVLSARAHKISPWTRHILKALKSIDIIIAPSEYIKQDLLSLGFDLEKIEVIYNGIDFSLFFPQSSETKKNTDIVDIQPFAIKRPYFIYPTRIQSSEKKHIELIRAFNLFKISTGLPHRLVLAGEPGYDIRKIQTEALSSYFSSDIFFTGHFEQKNLAELYRYADGCIFPAEGEGVALPVIEAMASGIPIAATKSGAVPEMAGTAAIYFDSNNIVDIAIAIERLATEKDLRKKLLSAGLEQSKKFDWDITAKKTLEILKNGHD
ncbi:MAG: glycosyltransferase family 1 protein [Treponemataceae bacterium]|nr:MAG: glycosyltransferase family 1 protein [Treponemataceae bacterium]